MKQILEFRPAARAEFDDAADWYEAQRSGLRAEFTHAVDLTLSTILNTPQTFPVVYGSNARRALIRKFPYAIIFSAFADKIIVYSVFHTSRSPMTWRNRL